MVGDRYSWFVLWSVSTDTSESAILDQILGLAPWHRRVKMDQDVISPSLAANHVRPSTKESLVLH